ncbi:MAG: ribonuclease HII [Candidatus Uhrbacteria bacterium]|nr:ribonuclease HII [Candidatus Uhrbacteria bacterium]
MKKLIIGIDEVGRGSWAGPLFFAAVCFTKNIEIPPGVFIRDSKALNRAQRARSSWFLRKNSIFSISRVSRGTIDSLGLQKASVLGLRRVIRSIQRKIRKSQVYLNEQIPDLTFLIDGLKICKIQEKHEFVVRGDDKIMQISSASIIAKVARDRHIARLGKEYPEYGFGNHMGYGTSEHQQALRKHGVCEIHRTSYLPIKKILEQSYAQK